MTFNRQTVRTALLLVLIGLAAAAILAGLDEVTRERIKDEQQAHALAAVSAMLSGERYDNELIGDTTTMTISGLPESATVYRARLDGEPAAAVIDMTTPQGYSGDIRLLVAVDTEGTVIGVRVLEHRETPGLGDKIERRRSDWIEQFTGRSLSDPEPDAWAPDRRDGAFDTLTSATITSTAVIDAVKRALESFESQKSEVFEDSPE